MDIDEATGNLENETIFEKETEQITVGVNMDAKNAKAKRE